MRQPTRPLVRTVLRGVIHLLSLASLLWWTMTTLLLGACSQGSMWQRSFQGPCPRPAIVRTAPLAAAAVRLAGAPGEDVIECFAERLGDYCYVEGIRAYPEGRDPRVAWRICWLALREDGRWCGRPTIEASLRECRPPDLAAVVPWEGDCDQLLVRQQAWASDLARRTGIASVTWEMRGPLARTILFVNDGASAPVLSETDRERLRESATQTPIAPFEAYLQSAIIECQGSGNPYVGRVVERTNLDLVE